jgi:imidazolonepropionase-like amidohydrolase
MNRWFILLTALIVVVILADRAQGQNQVLVIEGGTLVDGTGRTPLENSVVVIEGSRIKAVGAKGSISYPPQAKVIRGEGQTVLPGLIDAHIHFLDFMPQLFLHYGVTTVYDTANPTEWMIAQRDAIKKGKIRGPRMFVTGAIIDGPPERSDPTTFAARAAYRVHTSTPEEARSAARKLIEQGVDAIKVYEGLSIDALKAVVDEAHKAGLEVVGHTQDAREATLVGMKFIEHAAPIAHSTRRDPAKPETEMDPTLFDPLIELMVKNNVYFNPTLTRGMPESREWFDVAVKLLEHPSSKFITEARRESWLSAVKVAEKQYSTRAPERTESVRAVREFIRRFVKAGGKVITGPDSGPRSSPTNIAGLAMGVEMEGLIAAGMTPMQAILASTKWSAELLHKEKDLGTVEPGKLADIIIVRGNPLDNIHTISDVQTVILDGKIVDTNLDPNFRNPLPRTFYVDTPLEDRGPEITDLIPKMTREAGTKVAIQVIGKRFTARSIIRFDATDVPTTFISDSKLSGTLDAALLKKVGTYGITVVNPGSGGGTSDESYFIVNFRE